MRVAIEHARPQILGVLLDAIAHGLRKLPETHLDGLPCMADFPLWATACDDFIPSVWLLAPFP